MFTKIRIIIHVNKYTFFPNWRFLVRVKNPESGKIRNRHFEAAIIALPGSTPNQNQRIWKETYVFTWIIRGFTYFSPKLTFFYLRFASVKKRQFAGKKVKPLIIHVNKYTLFPNWRFFSGKKS